MVSDFQRTNWLQSVIVLHFFFLAYSVWSASQSQTAFLIMCLASSSDCPIRVFMYMYILKRTKIDYLWGEGTALDESDITTALAFV